MSIYYSGSLVRSSGLISAITKELRLINLKPVKKIQVKFDPFHPQAITARKFLYHISTPKIQETNVNCAIRTNIVCDRSDPEINIELLESGSIKFLANNLTTLEILQQINKHISSKVKVEEVSTIALTKSAKASVSVKKLNKRR